MSYHRVKWIITGLLVLGSACLPARPASSDEPKSTPPLDRARIEQRIQEIQPTAKEHRFDAIGWVSDISEAERLAKQHGRPVFLFSNVGRMDIGRC
jgi:hypothetical protein